MRFTITSCWIGRADGGYLLYRENHPASHSDVYLLPMRPAPSERKPVPLLTTLFDEIDAKFSPDARLVAYVSNESGDYEVYVRSTSKGARMPVSRTTEEARRGGVRRQGAVLRFARKNAHERGCGRQRRNTSLLVPSGTLSHSSPCDCGFNGLRHRC